MTKILIVFWVLQGVVSGGEGEGGKWKGDCCGLKIKNEKSQAQIFKNPYKSFPNSKGL